MKERSSLGVAANLAAALSYLFGWITGLIVVLLETRSEFVRFHARQSVFTFGGLTLIAIVINAVPVLAPLFAMLLPVLALVLWIVLLIKSYQGDRYKLPLVGDWAERVRIPGEPPLHGETTDAGATGAQPPGDGTSTAEAPPPGTPPPPPPSAEPRPAGEPPRPGGEATDEDDDRPRGEA